MEASINVFGQDLKACSTGDMPTTGFLRDGFCNTGPMDMGSHTLAAEVTPQFLQFSADRGNDLRSILKPGCRWCLCASRWKQALTAFRNGEVGRETVPSVILPATHRLALQTVSLKDLEEFSIDKSQGGGGHARSGNVPDPAAGGPIR